MSKFNTKSENKPSMTTNYMGENAFVLTAKEELITTVMTTFLSDGYYENQQEIVERIKEALDKVDPLFVAKLAVYARTEGNLRSVSHLLAALLADKVRGNEWAKNFFNTVVVRPDDMAEIIACYAKLHNVEKLSHVRPIPNAIKKAFKSKLESLDPYQIDKYKMNGHDINMKDLVNIFHPRRNEAFDRLMTGGKLTDLYDSKRLEVTMSASAEKAKDEDITLDEAKGDAIREVLNNIKGMPVMNMLRNLRNIILYCPEQYELVVEKLTNEQVILNSKQLPFRFVSAYQAVENNVETNDKTRIAKTRILEALEEALRISCKNIPVLEGKTAVLIDDSGSMRGDRGGSSRLSAFSSVTTAKIAHTFGGMMLHSQNDVYVGLFGDYLIDMPLKQDMKIMDFIDESYKLGEDCGGDTEQGIFNFFKAHTDPDSEQVDNVIVFSDCQIGSDASTNWYGMRGDDSGKFVELFKQFRKVNPLCNVFVVNLRQYGKTNVFHRSQRIFNIAGWSTSIFDLISKNAIGMDAMIEAIDNIKFN